jgi:maltose O-acetyltransferase
MILKKLLKHVKTKFVLALVNGPLAGTDAFKLKRHLLNSIGHTIGDGTKIVGPVFLSGTVIIGENCWIGRNFSVNGNGKVIIGHNCDIAPDVHFNTGGHAIGSHDRRAGDGEIYTQSIGNGSWIGARSTFVTEIAVGEGCMVAACACVASNVEADSLVGGVPAKLIRKLA